jgi:hypothetical protein
MVILTVTMQSLVRRSTGLTWSEMLAPHVPAVTVSVLLALLLRGVELAMQSVVGATPAWQLLPAQLLAALLFYAAFILFSPFAAVRQLVAETINDFLPARGERLRMWLRMPAARS